VGVVRRQLGLLKWYRIYTESVGELPVPHTFEFDEGKSRTNKQKHGIDFLEAQDIWLDGNLLRISARSEPEARFVFVGMLKGRHWSAIATYRGETIRLISVRRSRPLEVRAYEGE
jgi:uncharacterized DUF497 family protein